MNIQKKFKTIMYSWNKRGYAWINTVLLCWKQRAGRDGQFL